MKSNSNHLNKIVIYTAIFGGYDTLKCPEIRIDGCDYVCFTDDINLKSDLYDIRQCKRKFIDPTRENRLYKILPHRYFQDYEYSLYVDGSVRILTNDIHDMISRYLGVAHWAVHSHPERDCVYEEALACARAGKDDWFIIDKQMKKYRREGYLSHYGLTENTVLLRRHNKDEVIKLSEAWWSEVEKYSKRDQLSFNYIVWKQNFPYSLMDGYLWSPDLLVYDNKNFFIEPHIEMCDAI